jgi:hypothetical protein
MKKKIIGLHRKDGETREDNDFYATHPSAVKPLLDVLGWDSPKTIWENSCGQGHLSRELEKYGHFVISTDLIDRGYGVSGVDFLKDTPFNRIKYDAVIMNPPYKYAEQFVARSLIFAPVVCAFLRIQFLESEKRRKFFETNPPRHVCVFSSRIPSSKNARFSEKEQSTVCYAWFVWERGYTGKPQLCWI